METVDWKHDRDLFQNALKSRSDKASWHAPGLVHKELLAGGRFLCLKHSLAGFCNPENIDVAVISVIYFNWPWFQCFGRGINRSYVRTNISGNLRKLESKQITEGTAVLKLCQIFKIWRKRQRFGGREVGEKGLWVPGNCRWDLWWPDLKRY